MFSHTQINQLNQHVFSVPKGAQGGGWLSEINACRFLPSVGFCDFGLCMTNYFPGWHKSLEPSSLINVIWALGSMATRKSYSFSSGKLTSIPNGLSYLLILINENLFCLYLELVVSCNVGLWSRKKNHFEVSSSVDCAWHFGTK